MLEPKTVLAPTDFSEPSRDALDTAAEVAFRYGATLLLVHIVPAIPELAAGVSIFKEGDYERRLHEDAAKRLTALVASYSRKGLTVRTEVGTANEAGMEIVRIAERENADLIVIATHGMTGWHRLAFGSVAEKVMRASHCAVLLLRAQPTDVRDPSRS
jgi:nucleotide-binding universal stress UspA family protein